MRKEEFQTDKLIFPRGDWRCFVCLIEMRNLEILAETENEVCLICEICRAKNARMVEIGLNDF